MDRLANAVKSALDREGPEGLAHRTGIPVSTLYTLAKSEATPLLSTLRKLRAAGFAIPRDLLDAA